MGLECDKIGLILVLIFYNTPFEWLSSKCQIRRRKTLSVPGFSFMLQPKLEQRNHG